MEEQKEPDYDQQYSESFTKKIPFPLLKYEACKLNPRLKNVAYTLATASVHDDTKFTLYTTPETKDELGPIIEKLKGEDAVKNAEDKLKEQKKKKEEKKDEEEGEEEKKEEPPQADTTEPEKKKVDSRDPTERAILILNDKRAEEREKNKLEASKEEKKETAMDLAEPAMVKAKSSHADVKNTKENALSKENEVMKFEKLHVDETFNENLVNCTKILTLWNIRADGYRKIKDVYLFDTISNGIIFSEDGKFMLLTHTDSRTHMIYNAQTLEMVSKKELTAKTDDGTEVTYFYDSKLSYDGSYLIGGDSYNRYIFDQDLKFLKRIDGRNMYTIWQYSKTKFCGCKNADESYTKTDLVTIDFIDDKEDVIFNFDSYVSTIYLNHDNTAFCYDKYPKILYIDLKSKDKEPKEIIKEYYSLTAITFDEDSIGILYQPNWKNLW